MFLWLVLSISKLEKKRIGCNDMSDSEIIFEPIGVIHTPHEETFNTPIQPVFCSEVKGTIELNPEHVEGLRGVDGFSHIYVIFLFHQSHKTCLQLKPYLADQEQGVFATRAPHRPNKLGMSLVSLEHIDGNILHVKGVDILNGSPLLDIKPYVQRFDSRENVTSGWQDSVSNDEASQRGLRNFKA